MNTVRDRHTAWFRCIVIYYPFIIRWGGSCGCFLHDWPRQVDSHMSRDCKAFSDIIKRRRGQAILLAAIGEGCGLRTHHFAYSDPPADREICDIYQLQAVSCKPISEVIQQTVYSLISVAWLKLSIYSWSLGLQRTFVWRVRRSGWRRSPRW